jgi:hypothetical protein
VPLLPDGNAFADRWSAPHLRPDRDRLLGLLVDHRRRRPDQPIVILGGDIHVGCGHEVRLRGVDGAPVYQLVSSGLSNLDGWPSRAISRRVVQLAERSDLDVGELRSLSGEGAPGENPFVGLNAGILAAETASGRARLRFSLYGVEDRAAREVLRAELSG